VKVEKHQNRWQLKTLDNCKIITKKMERNAVNMRSDIVLAFTFHDMSPVPFIECCSLLGLFRRCAVLVD